MNLLAEAVLDPTRLGLPPVEMMDALPPQALPAAIAHLAALQARVASRLAPHHQDEADDPMTLEEVAEHLHVSRKRVLELTREAGGLSRLEVSKKELLIRRSDPSEPGRHGGLSRRRPLCIVHRTMTGEEFRRIRKRLGLTQVQLATQLGVHWNSVARWERGEVGISGPVTKLLRLLAGQTPAKRQRRTADGVQTKER